MNFLFITSRWIISGILLLTSMLCHAETVYVSDNLRVGIRTAPDSSIAPIDVVTSGMHLTVIKQQDGYIKISTQNGVTGWVKEVYMTKEIPPRVKLEALGKKFEIQHNKNFELEKNIKTLNNINKTLIKDLNTVRSDKSSIELKLAQATEEQYARKEDHHTTIWISISIITLLLGFIGGIMWYRVLVSRRLGGLHF